MSSRHYQSNSTSRNRRSTHSSISQTISNTSRRYIWAFTIESIPMIKQVQTILTVGKKKITTEINLQILIEINIIESNNHKEIQDFHIRIKLDRKNIIHYLMIMSQSKIIKEIKLLWHTKKTNNIKERFNHNINQDLIIIIHNKRKKIFLNLSIITV